MIACVLGSLLESTQFVVSSLILQTSQSHQPALDDLKTVMLMQLKLNFLLGFALAILHFAGLFLAIFLMIMPRDKSRAIFITLNTSASLFFLAIVFFISAAWETLSSIDTPGDMPIYASLASPLAIGGWMLLINCAAYVDPSRIQRLPQ